jgi:hypothetical protein
VDTAATQRKTLKVAAHLHRKLKVAAADSGRDLEDLTNEIIGRHFANGQKKSGTKREAARAN